VKNSIRCNGSTARVWGFSVLAFAAKTCDATLAIRANPIVNKGVYRNTTTLADVTKKNETYHYHSSHDLTADGRALGGSFGATDERQAESTSTLVTESESEVWNSQSGFSVNGNNRGYLVDFYAGPLSKTAPLDGESPPVTFTKSKSLVVEGGFYQDVRSPSGQVVRQATGAAVGASRVESGAERTKYFYHDNDPQKYQSIGWTATVTPSQNILESESLTVRSDTTEQSFTLFYSPLFELRGHSDSKSSVYDTEDFNYQWQKTLNPNTQEYDWIKEGEKNESYHLEKTFPHKGTPSGWEVGHAWGWQTDVDGNLEGDLWPGEEYGTEWEFEAPAGNDPFAELEPAPPPRAPVQSKQPGGPGGVVNIGAPAPAEPQVRPQTGSVLLGALLLSTITDPGTPDEAPAQEEQSWGDWLRSWIPFLNSAKDTAVGGMAIDNQRLNNKAAKEALFRDILNGKGNVTEGMRVGNTLGDAAPAARGLAQGNIEFSGSATAMAAASSAAGAPLRGSRGMKAGQPRVVGVPTTNVATQVHHIATNKGEWGNIFTLLFKKAGLSPDDAINKMNLPAHVGRHTNAYHQHVYDKLYKAIGNKTGKAARKAAEKALNELREELTNNPRLPYSDGGLQ
jgi:hypothetical protein